MNAEQAPKGLMWELTRREIGEGRSHWGMGSHPAKRRKPVVSPGYWRRHACRGDSTQHGKPRAAEARDLQPDSREGQAGPGGVADRLAVPLTPGNAGRGKGPVFKISVTKAARHNNISVYDPVNIV